MVVEVRCAWKALCELHRAPQTAAAVTASAAPRSGRKTTAVIHGGQPSLGPWVGSVYKPGACDVLGIMDEVWAQGPPQMERLGGVEGSGRVTETSLPILCFRRCAGTSQSGWESVGACGAGAHMWGLQKLLRLREVPRASEGLHQAIAQTCAVSRALWQEDQPDLGLEGEWGPFGLQRISATSAFGPLSVTSPR